MGFVKEFKDFAMKGNVVDLAVGVIIGGAFGKIVSSLVGDIIMPVVGLLTGGVDFKELKFIMKAGSPEVVADAAKGIAASPAVADVSMNYGMFIQNVFDFLVIALCIFMMIKAMNSAKKKEVEAPAAPAGPTQEELLAEIRDLLKK